MLRHTETLSRTPQRLTRDVIASLAISLSTDGNTGAAAAKSCIAVIIAASIGEKLVVRINISVSGACV
jgi:hypothetical protein